MQKESRDIMNKAIAEIHDVNDVLSYDVDTNKRIRFPRGFLRTLKVYRSYFSFIEDTIIKDRVAKHMMHRDTLHWLWLKTDIAADAREMIVKFQLINLASILEATVKNLKPKMPKKKDNVYERIDLLQEEDIISNGGELKALWAARNTIHLHLSGGKEEVKFSDENYKAWHRAMGKMIEDLKGKK